MNDESDHGPAPTAARRPYVKPELTRIELRPEEAVLGACKNGTSSGPAGAPCTITGCSTPGS